MSNIASKVSLCCISFFIFNFCYSQTYSLYSNDTLSFSSQYLNETLKLNFHLPETQAFAKATTTYPIAIIFDSQHERTYPQIINSFDLLTSEAQIPEHIIIGIPFTMQNRRYYTSFQKKETDSLSGIERMKLFIFEELIPKIQKEYNGSHFIGLIGHSRTAFLTSYLSYTNPSKVNLALSLSGFFDETLSVETFSTLLTSSNQQSNQLNFYFSAGSSKEEETYLEEYKRLSSLVSNQSLSNNIGFHFIENPNANHMTNYWTSIPPILIDAYSAYNSILNEWLHVKLKSGSISKPEVAFQMDLNQAGEKIGTQLNPNLTQVYSILSYYLFEKKDYQKAIDFTEFALAFYPDYLELYVELIEAYRQINNVEKAEYYKAVLKEKTEANTYLNKAEKDEIWNYLNNN